MQELRLVAVSEDGSYAIVAVPGRSDRFLLPIDDRLRTVAKGQFSRLAQYEIEVENPLRPRRSRTASGLARRQKRSLTPQASRPTGCGGLKDPCSLSGNTGRRKPSVRR